MNRTIKTVLFATLLLALVGISASVTQVAASPPSESVDEFKSDVVVSPSSSTSVEAADKADICHKEKKDDKCLK